MRLTIRFKLIAAIVAGLLVVSGVAAGLMRFVYERAARIAAESSIRNAAATFANLEKNEGDKLGVGLQALSASPDLRKAFLARDRAALLSAAEPIFRELRERHHITHWYFILPDRTVFLRVHLPSFHGDLVARPSLVRAAETGDLAIGKDLGKTAFALRAVLPWRVGGEVVGYLELGQEIDAFLSTMKAETGDDYAMFVEKSHLDPQAWAEQKARMHQRNGWDDHASMVLVHTTAPLAWPELRRLAHELPSAGEALPREAGDEPDHVLGVFSTRDGTGHGVGAVLVRHEMRSMRAGLDEVRGRVVLTVVLLAAGLAALVVFLLDTLVFERLRRMSVLFEQLPERMARGDYRLEEALEPPPDDELGRFETLFHRAVNVIGGALREIERAREPKEPRARP